MKKIALALLLLIAITGCDSKPSQQAAPVQPLSIKGSDTMVHLVSSWAEEFMKNNTETDISVTGGGSGTGIAAMINGTTDICASSRAIQEKESFPGGDPGGPRRHRPDRPSAKSGEQPDH